MASLSSLVTKVDPIKRGEGIPVPSQRVRAAQMALSQLGGGNVIETYATQAIPAPPPCQLSHRGHRLPMSKPLARSSCRSINYGISCSGSNIALQAEIKRLKDKYEPPKVDAEKKK